MRSVEFAYWLQGLFELTDTKTLDEKQTALIKAHLAMVFKHEIDPSYGDKEKQEALQQIHDITLPEVQTPKPPYKFPTHPNDVIPCNGDHTKYRC